MRSRLCLFGVALIVALIGGLRADWVRLADGEVARLLKREGGRASVRMADGEARAITWDQVDGVLTDVQAAAEVRRVLAKMRSQEPDHAYVRSRLEQLKAAAVPPLLAEWKTAVSAHDRAVVMACFQFCWSYEAKKVLISALDDDDDQVRCIARKVVERQLPYKERQELHARMKDHDDPALAGPGLAQDLLANPDGGALAKALENAALRRYVHALLPNYQSPSMTGTALKLLESQEEMEKASAMLALIYQMAEGDDVRKIMRVQLTAEQPLLRDLAAEYWRWHGRSGDGDLLKGALERESEPYVRASLDAALKGIASRAAWPGAPSRELVLSKDTPDFFGHATEWFSVEPSVSGRHQMIGALQKRLPVNPFFTLLREEDVVAAFGEGERVTLSETEAKQWGRLLGLLGGYGKDGVRGGPDTLPVAREWMPPTREYFDPKRESFGLFIDPDKFPGNPFANRVHVGDDVAWRKQGTTVVAIANGVVRIATPCQGSWGGLVVLEHGEA